MRRTARLTCRADAEGSTVSKILPPSLSIDDVKAHKSGLILYIRMIGSGPIRRMALSAAACELWLVLRERQRRKSRLDSAKHLLLRAIKG